MKLNKSQCKFLELCLTFMHKKMFLRSQERYVVEICINKRCYDSDEQIILNEISTYFVRMCKSCQDESAENADLIVDIKEQFGTYYTKIKIDE